MTMSKNGNNGGGRIAYASRAAAQLLGLDGMPSPSPKKARHSRSPQMNHPIQLKFSSNKQPLFPRRRVSDSYSDKYAMRPHSTNISTSNHNVQSISRPISLPATPTNSGGGGSTLEYASKPITTNQLNANPMYRSPPHRNQLRMSQHASSYNNLSRTHHQPLGHPRSAHNVQNGATSNIPIKALPNSNILQNMVAHSTHNTVPPQQSTSQSQSVHPVLHHHHHRHHRQAVHSANGAVCNQSMMNGMNAPKPRRHLSASAASASASHLGGDHRVGPHPPNQAPPPRGVVRPHSYSPTKSSTGFNVDELNTLNLPQLSHNTNNQTANPLESGGKQNASNIRVVIRVRPLSDNERRDRCTYCIKPTSDRSPNSIVVQQLNKRDGTVRKEKQFTFDKICHEDTQQAQFFKECGVKQLVDAALNGYAATMFAYGQTGSGKTYTVCGENESLYDEEEVTASPGVHQLSGIIPRTILDFWTKMERNSRESSRQYVVRAGYLEIYNERPRDLLNPHFSNLSVRWNSETGFFVENQCIVRCESSQDLLAVFNEGEMNRQTGSHDLNAESSRSHCLFTIHVESRQQMNAGHDEGNEDSYVQNGKISIVDLAGSEKLKDSKQVTDKGLRETANINRSLFTLGKVISILEKVQSKELAASTYIPYRDSVLTKLLMDSLGGSGMALMVACVSPANVYVDETLSTLNYASRARNIQNVPTKKINAKDRIIAQLIQEVQRLKTENLRMKQYILKCANPTMALNANGVQNQMRPIHSQQTLKQQPVTQSQSMSMQQQQAVPQQLSRHQRPQYLTQSQPSKPQPVSCSERGHPQIERPSFSWETASTQNANNVNMNRTNMNGALTMNSNHRQQSPSNNGVNGSRAVLHPLSQQHPPTPQSSHHQQQSSVGMRVKPPLRHGYSSPPMYPSTHQQQATTQHDYRNQIESLQAAKECAEQQATEARQENTKLMDKIEHLETVFMR